MQSNSVLTNTKGTSLLVRFKRDINVTVKVYVVKEPLRINNINEFC